MSSLDLIVSPYRGFAEGYAALEGAYDEMVEPGGALRPHWRPFVAMLDELGPDELTARWEQARRLIHENGVTHNVYGSSTGMDRPWNLDFAPLLLPADQWRAVEQGLAQRARLLDLLLADIYGPGEVVRDGILPPELIFANPGFLRPCHGIRLPGGTWLHQYAADLGRGRDGKLMILSDRTQAPSGAGYTLENRIVISRVLPNLFRACNVQRLAAFFLALRQNLAAIAPGKSETPSIVLLTPGPYNETYFEHAYLARYLGFILVQGNDLTVRDRKVFLKTLGGLQRVDVIVRRVDDEFCDPLELLPHSFLGVPGLLEAVREGNVVVANALGAGVLQAPAFLPYLPRICRRLLDEDLQLQCVPTWWCGDVSSRQFVLDNLPTLVIKPAFPARGLDPVFGEKLSKSELLDLKAKISARPGQYVAQDMMIPSTAPVLLNRDVQCRHLVIRAFLTTGPQGQSVMPGALTRITGSSDSLVVSLQKGGGSKDTWVLSDGPVSEISLLRPPQQLVELSRGGGDLPSRVADDLFWLGRYVERAESIVRLARGTFSRLIDDTTTGGVATVAAMKRALLWTDAIKASDADNTQLLAVIFNPDIRSGLYSTVQSIHDLARVLRDRISSDAWRIVQAIHRDFTEFELEAGGEQLAGVLDLLNQMVISLAAFTGLVTDSTTRGQSWRFLDIGRRLERAIGVSRLLRYTVVDVIEDEPSLLEAVLETAESSLTYRRRYLTHLQVAAVCDLLLADETNPRAIAFQLATLDEHLASVPRESAHPQQSPDRQALLALRCSVRMAVLPAICATKAARRPRLDALLQEILDQLQKVSDAVSQIFFTHALASRQMLSVMPEGE